MAGRGLWALLALPLVVCLTVWVHYDGVWGKQHPDGHLFVSCSGVRGLSPFLVDAERVPSLYELTREIRRERVPPKRLPGVAFGEQRPVDVAKPDSLRGQPVNAAVVVLLLGIAYVLFDRRVDPAAVAVSLAAAVEEGELWRCVTASLSHFEALHLGMNVMSLVQLGGLVEARYGSLWYLTQSVALVLLTMAALLGMHWVLVHSLGKEAFRGRSGVGYSCVLFALAVVVALDQPKMCPVPDVCFHTYRLGGFGVSAYPFVMLLAMHFLVPRASLTGHLAGILLGYPLAWGLLDELSLPLVLGFTGIVVQWWLRDPSSGPEPSRQLRVILFLHLALVVGSTYLYLSPRAAFDEAVMVLVGIALLLWKSKQGALVYAAAMLAQATLTAASLGANLAYWVPLEMSLRNPSQVYYAGAVQVLGAVFLSASSVVLLRAAS